MSFTKVASVAVGKVAVAATHTLYGFAITNIGAALAPWFGAFEVGGLYAGVSVLYDIRDGSDGRITPNYTCTCHHCKEDITYIIDKKEGRVSNIALGVVTLGVYTAGKGIHSTVKSGMNGRPKEMHCRSLISSARTIKCPKALATIMFLVADNESESYTFYLSDEDAAVKINNDKVLIIQKTFAIVMSADGWKELRRKF
jgi:hypothetical protein